MRYLKTNTATRVTVGPFLDVTDFITPEIALTVTNCHVTFTVDTGGVPTLVLDTAPTASGGNNDMVHITSDAVGFYDLELTAANTNYLGRAMLAIHDTDVHLPVFHEFTILPANVYDAMILGTDSLEVDATAISGDTTAADNLETACDGGSYNVGGGSVVAASVTGATGSVTGAVGSVTGNVGGNVTGSVGSVAGAVGSVTGNVGGNVTGSVGSLTGHTVQTGDTYALANGASGFAAIKTDTGNLVTRITATLFAGITSLAEWLGLMAGKQAADATALTEVQATGAGSGSYSETTDSLEAVRDRGDAAWPTATSVTVSDKTGFSLAADQSAVTIGTVNSSTPADGSITAAKLGADAITEAKIADNALANEHFAAGALTDAECAADVTKLSGSAAAANNLEASALGIVSSTAKAGTLSTTQATTNLTEATDDHYKGRILVWTGGDCAGQATDITAYTGATKLLTYTAMTDAPSADDAFVIV